MIRAVLFDSGVAPAERGLHSLLFRDQTSLRSDLGALLGTDLVCGSGSCNAPHFGD